MITKKTSHVFTCIIFCLLAVLQGFSQNLTSDDYIKALWMTTRMYGGQRSGDGPNWLIMNHSVSSSDASTLASAKGYVANKMQAGKCFTDDADGTHSLSGGWVDCGDHVKFGQTMFYSAYVLLKGYAEFPEGYDDFYSFDYSGYKNSGDFTWEGRKGIPNGIPDILDEVKYQTDFLIKCARNNTTFYSQVGDGDADHKNWVTSVAMAALPKTEGGQANGARNIVKNPNDASMPSFAAATLALMARVYAPFDPEYADLCLTHALYAYNYAKSKRGKTLDAGQFYPANAKWEDDYACACAELYWTTGNASYRTEALSYAGDLGNHNWCFNYNNNDDIAAYNLAKLGDTGSKSLLESLVNTYKGNVSGGLYSGGDGSWGPLRYNANAAFVVAMWGALNNSTTVDAFIYNQINYILGANSSNHSFVVGFNRSNCSSCRSTVKPHHRNVFLKDDIMGNKETFTIPTKNAQHGFLVGGTRNPGTVSDKVENYYQNEGGIDYNAGLVGALGYIVSRIAPVDINKFGHPSPDLGDELTLCGTGSATITATVDLSSLQPGETVTYKWYKGNATTPFQQGDNVTSVTVTQADTYRCDLVEKSGAWKTSGSVVVTATLPNVSLGDDVTLCEITSKTLDAGVSGTGVTYTWTKNGSAIPGATNKTYTVYDAGTYAVTVSATGCSSKTDNVVVTSSLPEVVHDTICAPGTVTLKVVPTGSYDWYTTETGGTAVGTGQTYSTSINSSTTFYVQDASSVSGTVGPTTATSSSFTNWGVNENLQMAFTVGSSFTVNSMKIAIQQVYDAASGTITVEILKADGTEFSPAKKFTSNSVNVTTAMGGTLVEFPFDNFNIDKSWGTNLRIRLSAVGFNGAAGFNESGASYPYNSTPSGVMTITGAYNGGESKSNWYLYFYNWKISAGSACARAPVLAVIDPLGDCGDTQAPSRPGTVTFSSTTTNSMNISWTASTDNVGVVGYDVYVNGSFLKSTTTNNTSLTDLQCNTQYSVYVIAKDAAGNTSTQSTAASNTTTGITTPTITSNSPVCAAETITLSVPATTGATYAWTGPNGYTATTRTVSRTNATTAMAGTYNATITVNGCTSTAATTTVVVNAIPSAPGVVTPVEYIVGESATPLSASGGNLLWYTYATGGTGSTSAPTPSTVNVGTTSYYVSQTVSTCESSRAKIDVIVSSNEITQTIPLASGWNLISFYVVPSNASVSSVFGTSLNQIDMIKNSDGFYKPSQNAVFQSITAITLGESYLVYANTPTTISVTGVPESNVSVSLKQGWNMLGYPKSTSATITSALSSIWNNVEVIKNFEAFKDKTSGTLNNLTPGEGYYIYMNNAGSVDF